MKNNINLFSSISRVLLLTALLLPGWQMFTVGQETLKNIPPWNYLGYKTGECGDGENKTFPYCGLNNTGYAYNADANGGWGKRVERGDKKDDKEKKAMVYLVFNTSRTLPPYAQEIMDWGYSFCCQSDKSESLGSLYYFRDSISTWDTYVNTDHNASAYDNDQLKDYIVEEHRNLSSNGGIFDDVCRITFDNSSNSNPGTVTQWLLMVGKVAGDSNTGHAKVTIKTTSANYTLYYPRFSGAGTAESPLQIASGADLKAFATIINSGADGTANLYAILTNDIDYTSYTDASAMIGTRLTPYKGVFDGQGHSVTLAFNNTTEEYTGLFGHINGATIKNMKVNGSMTGLRMLGGVVGNAIGNVTLENVISSVSITASSSTGGIGGLISAVGDDKTAWTYTIRNCAFTGSVEGDFSKMTYNGLSYVREPSTLNITNCYTAVSTTSGSTRGENFAVLKGSKAKANVTNCYYTKQMGSSTQGTQVTDEQMTSGEVCYLLNNKVDMGEPWLQAIGTDKAPTLWDALRVKKVGIHYFNFEPSFRGAGTELDPFQIETVQDLEKFRDIVNSGYNTICAKMVANIDLANRNWRPIGCHTTESDVPVTYSGIFDGNGYIISNLSSNTGIDNHAGLFGTIKNATIKNVLLKNVTVSALSAGHAGTVAGRSESSAIENCGVYGIISLSGGTSANGIAYIPTDAGTIKNCYTVYGNVTESQIRTVNCHCGKDVEDMHASGELTYKLNDGKPTPWKQNIGSDEYPVLRGALSVYAASDGTYYNDSYQGSTEAGFIDNTSGKDFIVYHHGGRLYEFVITMATQDGAGINTCPDAMVRYSIDGQWQTIFTLSDVNADKLDFSEDWWGRITPENGQGTVYDSRTYHANVPTFWIRQGNHSTCKQTSLLWLAPEALTSEPSSFMLKGVAEESQLSISSKAETAELSDDSGFSVVDPITALDQSVAGASYLIISGSNYVYGYGIWDATDNCFVETKELPEGSNSLTLLLPQQDCTHDIVALLHSSYVAYDSEGKADTTYTLFAAPVVQKPSHSIVRTNISRDYSYNASNVLQWAIGFPADEDILDSDMFSIVRSSTSDFAEYKSLGSFSLADYTSTDSTSVQDTVLGWFSFTDDSEDSHYTTERCTDTLSAFDTWNLTESQKAQLSVYKYPARYLYYKVWRSTFGSVWSNSDLFKAYWNVLLTDVLPTVDTVRIIKDEEFDKNHKITVRIVLNNPYPWEVVDESDRSAVQAEAERQHFSHRMFVWDEGASIILQRYSTADEYDNGQDVIAKTVTISGNQVKQDSETGEYYVEYSDVASMAFVHYYYKAKVDSRESNYPICGNRNHYVSNVDPCYSEQFGGIYNFEATKGTVKGAVDLTWEADENSSTTLELKRREYKRGYYSEKELAGWSTMTASEGTATDEEAVAAVVNEYIISITTKYREHVYTESDTAYGYADWHGTVSGRVKMENGVNVPGDVKVYVERGGAFDLQAVTDPRNGEAVLPAVHYDAIKHVLLTDHTGSYRWDYVPFYGTGMQYEVNPECGLASFISPTGSSRSITLTYGDADYEYPDIDFTCDDTKRFSGRILYTNSTVPVRDAYFIVNGTVLRNAEGEPVTTDETGNFSFTVPTMEVTVRAFKKGHKMTNDGYILGGDNGDAITFTPKHDYDGLVIYDDTKVRLVGRIAGGVIQGAKPLGFGLADNNLGDDITVVLQLEGDNTSFLYYDRKKPDSKSYSGSFTQTVVENFNTAECIPTDVTFESKRIVIKADNETGEFCLDLFPVKYKVSQIYANGYSTLYSAGEGLTVMDLSDSVGLHVRYAHGKSTEYDASFRKVYHAPVQVDLLQLQGNKYQKLFGSQSLEVGMLSGTHDMQLAWQDTLGIAQYTFGYPVYKSYRQYNFMVQAYEPYYYNNDALGSYDRVPMAGYEVSISNGFNRFEYDDEEEEEEEEDETDEEEEDDEEDDEDEEEGDGLLLNASGSAMFSIVPNNTTFTMTGGKALRYLSASVDVNGYHYESDPVAAYITGDCSLGTEVMTSFESAPKILDYIRDPYGEESYAYRAAGTTYNWARHYEEQVTWDLDMDIDLGFAIFSGFGFGAAEETEYEVFVTGNVNIVADNKLVYKDGEFSLTLSDQLSTSDDNLNQGAMADIYLGTASTADVVKYQTFNVVDSLTYRVLRPAIESGVSKLVAEGRNADGSPNYLVICGGVTWQPGEERIYAYSQSHIMNVVIPNLEARRDESLRLASDMDEAVKMAALSGHTFYYQNADNEYLPVYPSSLKVKVDSVALLSERIQNWQDIIAENERIKYEAMSGEADMKYSLGCMKLEHSEEASTYYRVTTADGPKPVTFSIGVSQDQESVEGNGNEDTKDNDGFKGMAVRFNIAASAGREKETSNSYENYTTMEGGSGFLITAIDNAYYDMDIYYEKDASIVKVDDEFKNDINAYEGGSGVDDYVVTNETQKMTDDNTYVHSYVFVMRAGASRNRWIDADSSYFYKPDGARVALGVPTLKIDNPKIYVEDPVRNNVPQDEKAVFTIRLSNESEMTGNVYNIITSLYLHVDDASNPHGAKLSIDGVPLRNNMEIFLSPGEYVTKTLEVERGGKPFDYENIKLEFTDELRLLKDVADISVHYLPTSSPVTLTQPAQNFLINTLSQVDEEGKYYIPVQIEGFSTTKYENFDHIEFQYKRQTDSEDQWVNLCSYYVDDSLYARATGTKAMIETEGKISDIRFYGENDPVEMKYDLRAVTFCRLGTGYTTRQSEIISGTKDTRCPEVFGLPKPVDGILDADEVISLPFTEPIAYNYLDETANFSVQGYTNSSDADNGVSLYFSGADNHSAVSSVSRVLNNMDFTVEMNVQPDAEASGFMSFLSIADDYASTDDAFAFGYEPGQDRLMAYMGGESVYSMPVRATLDVNLSSTMTHVGMKYETADSTVRFFVGESWLEVSADCHGKKYSTQANGVVKLGYNYKGRMGNIRIWSKALNTYEMQTKYGLRLSSNESDLLAYWPAVEALGTTLYDAANGADITMENVSWSLPDGFSVKLDHQPMNILKSQTPKFTRDKQEDFTLSFWFKASEADGDADLFAAGSDALEETGMDKVRIRFVNGVLYYITEGNSYAFGDENDFLSDAAWHYLAVTVNHSQNKLALYIDGRMVNQAATDGVGGMTGSVISFGSSALKANVDEIEVWGMALPASYIKKYYNTALLGTEKELLVYMNFEQDEENSQGTMSVSFSPYNQVITSAGTIAGDKMVEVAESQQDGDDASPVCSSAGIRNLPFRWKSTDNELQITLDETLPSDINNQQINIVVRNVEDVNGNPMKNAQMWSAYVKYNVLSWNLATHAVVLPYGADTTIAASFSNTSGKALSYTIDCSCPYITLSKTMGTVGPLASSAISIQISDGLAPGVYFATVNLIDENNLCSKLTVDILVKATEPDWQVTADASYNQLMDVAAVVKKHSGNGWIVDMCPKDLVGAFIGKICVGKAYLTVDAANNASYVFLSIRGKEELKGEEIEFRLFNAMTGETSILSRGKTDGSGVWTIEPVCFESNAIIGGTEPVEMRTTDTKVQTITLNPGWNWISLNVKPLSSVGLNNLFQNQGAFVADDMFKHLYEGFAYYQRDNTWEASLDNMEMKRDNVYQVYSRSGGDVTVAGLAYDDAERVAVLDFSQSEWAELAYLSEQSQPISRALSDFVAGSAKAPAGTVINGYNDFAVAREDGTWFGSLEYMRPGEGYYVRRNGLTEKVEIRYANVTKSSMPAVVQPAAKSAASASLSMPVIAIFSEDYQAGDVLLAIVNGNIVGRAEAMRLDGQSVRFMVSVHGADGDRVTFAKERNGEIVGATTKTLRFDGSSVLGTLENPYLINFEETTVEGIYDVMGLRYNGQDNLPTDRVFIIGNKKIITSK